MDTNSQDQETKKLQLSIAIVTILVCSFAIFLTIIYFIFNIRYRNFRLIKMSSPNINNIINLNCLLLYLCPIFNSIKGLNIYNDFLSNTMCQVNAWIIPICSTMLYGAMLAKAWRIFKIFDTTPKMKKIVIKDIRLIVYIFILVLVDLIILFTWQFYDTIKIRLRYVYEMQQFYSQQQTYNSNPTTTTTLNPIIISSNLTNNSLILNEQITSTKLSSSTTTIGRLNNTQTTNTQIKILYECTSSFNEVWITVLTIYKIILLMYGIYLSWLIKNVNVPSMNDAKYLLLSTYTIIVCGLGSMTLIQLLRDWPDVVQVFFTIGIVVATCTTQCLLFIPKIILWYKRRNDDNFKISLSQIFLQSSSSCYYTDKQSRNSTNTTNANILNLEDELCELLHENSQLKNFLKEKEEVIKILQEKIRGAKASLFHMNDNKNENSINILMNSENSLQANQTISSNAHQKLLLSSDTNINSAPSTMNRQTKANHHDSGYDIESTINTMPNSETQSFENLLSNKTNKNAEYDGISHKNINQILNTNLLKTTNAEKLKNELDEVEELTSRVRDSISIDLSSTRRYSPLLYEYYRKQLELAKSIQSTYNIQCNTLFDAMTLMRKCLKDYCQTVHNPEYFAIDSFQNVKNGGQPLFQAKTSSFANMNPTYEQKLTLSKDHTNNNNNNNNKLPNLNTSSSFNNPNVANRPIKYILSSNTFSYQNSKNDSPCNTFLSSETSATTSATSSPSVSSTVPSNLNSTTQLDPKISIENNKQTYV